MLLYLAIRCLSQAVASDVNCGACYVKSVSPQSYNRSSSIHVSGRSCRGSSLSDITEAWSGQAETRFVKGSTTPCLSEAARRSKAYTALRRKRCGFKRVCSCCVYSQVKSCSFAEWQELADDPCNVLPDEEHLQQDSKSSRCRNPADIRSRELLSRHLQMHARP